MNNLKNIFSLVFKNIDWTIVFSVLFVSISGLLTMNSFSDIDNNYFEKQIIWLLISFAMMFVLSRFSFSFLKRGYVVVWIYVISSLSLILLFFLGTVSRGSQSWFDLGGFSIQPAEFAKLALIILLAKYFSNRHIEIKNVKHILISGFYAGILCLLVLIQPDFGSAIILFFIWFGVVLVSGISKKHLAFVVTLAALLFGFLWFFIFQDYQKARIINFLRPLSDIQGAGYNAYQSMITVGSGQVWGKGIGFGTQSRLKFLPEYQTDFIFSAFAEEWGFVGVIILFIAYSLIVWRIIVYSLRGLTNFETYFGIGLAIMLMVHIIIHIGMNIGLLPVTGITVPFMSYGGSHLLVTFVALGILMGMGSVGRPVRKTEIKNDYDGFIGV